jgi:CTP:molybdopterin cytidylyltransferase MocA
MMRIGAVILAAGAGRRMGGVAKALLADAGRTYLEQIVAAAREVGLADGVVVVGPPHQAEIALHARALGLRLAVNASPERGMASSVGIGFAAVAEGDAEAAWLWPVDHPHVAPTTLRALIEQLGARAVARPVVDGRGGHPPLIARALWPRLASCGSLDGGARAVLADADRVDVPVADRGCVHDIDTPEDLP